MTAQLERESFPDTRQVPVRGEEERLHRVLYGEMSSEIFAITFMAEALRARLEASRSPEAASAFEINERLADLAQSIRSKLTSVRAGSHDTQYCGVEPQSDSKYALI